MCGARLGRLQAAGCSPLDRGTTRRYSRAPARLQTARQGPSPEESHGRYIPSKIVVWNIIHTHPENVPASATIDYIPIQTDNRTISTSELHTHVMSNENKFPSKRNVTINE